MNRSKAGKWTRRVVWVTLAAVLGIGCSPLNIIAFMFDHGEKVPAKYPLVLGKDSPRKDKDEVVVLLLPHLAPGSSREFATAERELADKLAKMLPEMAKENKEKKSRKLRVVSPTQVDKFKMTNPQWKQLPANEIGQKLGADFVLEIELDKMRLYQPGSLNNIYEGRAEVEVKIYEVGTEGLKDTYMLPFAYPRTGVRSVDAIPVSKFRMLFFDNLAAEIAQMHVDTNPSNSIADGK